MKGSLPNGVDIQAFTRRLNEWGQSRIPFIFVVDFELQLPLAWRLDEVDSTQVLFDFNGKSNTAGRSGGQATIQANPIAFLEYQKKFDRVMDGLLRGDSFLTNLTITTPVQVDKDLEELFHLSKAKYKLMLKERFLVFSPETFIKIRGNTISTFPMKGTISADVDRAEEVILADRKEMAEHVTIVDLLRNDLSIVADNVRVERFRFIDEVQTHRGILLQVSSEISGDLLPEFRNKIGSLIVSLLPAGSVSGAPKRQTCRIIEAAEGEKRGFYTGVCGYFDGETLDSAVMIRFIEQRGAEFFFRSGGGITTQSKADEEFKEALDKIYVPVF